MVYRRRKARKGRNAKQQEVDQVLALLVCIDYDASKFLSLGRGAEREEIANDDGWVCRHRRWAVRVDGLPDCARATNDGNGGV